MRILKPLGELYDILKNKFCLKYVFLNREIFPLSGVRQEFRSIMRPSSCDGNMVSQAKADILDSIAEEYQVRDRANLFKEITWIYQNISLQQKTFLAGLPEGSPLVRQRILELKEEWKREIKYPEDMETE